MRPLLIAQVTASLAWGVLDEAALGFLGLAVLLVVFSFNLFGDGLRDLFDPRAWNQGE